MIDHRLFHGERLQRADQPEWNAGRAAGGGMGDRQPAASLKRGIAVL
jgi:hypothetical protein